MNLTTYNTILSKLIAENSPAYTLEEITTTLNQAINELIITRMISRFDGITV